MQFIEQNGLRILTPDDPDNWLTNGETYSQRVYLGSGDGVEKWREITPDEYAGLFKTLGISMSEIAGAVEFYAGLTEGYEGA